jgi:hypothetical protein
MTSTVEFYKADFNSTLYPLRTNLLMIEIHAKEISDYIYQEILDEPRQVRVFYRNSEYTRPSQKAI